MTEGYDIPISENYPSQLQQKLNREGYEQYTIVNLGVSGDTTATGLKRIDEVLAAKPNIVILALGGNDGLRRIVPTETRENLRQIVQTLRAADIEVLLAGIKFPLLLGGWKYNRDYELMYKEIAAEFDIPLIPSLLKGVVNKDELNLDDNIHPNRAGYEVVVENVWEKLKEMLE